MTKLPLLTAAALAIVAVANPALARPARCEIVLGNDTYKGPCEFEGFGRNGSFALSVKGREEIIPSLGDVQVEIVAPDVGVVSGHNSSGHGRSFFDGAFLRSKAQPSCWEQKGSQSDDGRVCVR